MKRVGTHCNRDDRRWLRVADVAQTLSVSPRLVYKMIDNGDLPAVQLGRAVRIPMDALRQWIADKEAEAEETRRRYGK